eukprot:m.1094155 g.1094155  ORF g.1094155 m.1094155 type:complete len:66 (-) comp24300_c0_seq8:1623-1820(-)
MSATKVSCITSASCRIICKSITKRSGEASTTLSHAREQYTGKNFYATDSIKDFFPVAKSFVANDR